MTRSVGLLSLALLLSACATSGPDPREEVYWDLPETGSYWVPKGVDTPAIFSTAQACGAHVDSAIAHHIPIPPGYAYEVFHFVGENTPEAKACTLDRLRAIPRLTARSRSVR